MLQRTIYVCEKCGLEIEEDYEKMLNHEDSHVVPKKFQTLKVEDYSHDSPYPLVVTIEMSNGAKVQYTSPCEMEAPTEKESPSETD